MAIFNTNPTISRRSIQRRRRLLLAGIACAGLAGTALPAFAYTPQTFDASKDTGQDFTTVPANTPYNSAAGINQKIWSNIWGNHFYFAGSSGLWITSSAAGGWPTSGMMQVPTSCAAGFGYGDFHWRAAIGDKNQGPGANMIMWPADNDPGWPGIERNSDSNLIGEVDVFETNYGSNGTTYSTFHFYNGSVGGHDGQIIHSPDTYLTGDMTAMHDYDEVWGPGSLVLKIDGVVQMSAPPSQVRPDYAHGGCNYTLGGQMAMQATGYDHTPDDWVEIAAMWWSATDQSAGGGTSVPITAPAPAPPPGAPPPGAPPPLAPPPGAPPPVAPPFCPKTPVAPTPVAPKPVGPTPVAPTPVAPTPVAPTSSQLSITGITIAAVKGVNSAYLIGNKEVGAKATLREYIDGTYRGTLWDGMPDGAFDFQSIMLPAGTHTLKLTLDGSTATATVTYTLSGTTVTLSH